MVKNKKKILWDTMEEETLMEWEHMTDGISWTECGRCYWFMRCWSPIGPEFSMLQ